MAAADIDPRLRALLSAGSWTDAPDAPTEVRLPGGDVTQGVVRIGDTVRRPRQVQSGAVAALLCHLTDAGFSGTPRFLGTDAMGRDVLEYLPGHTAGQPPEAWIASDKLLDGLGRLIRRLHEASAGFLPPTGLPFFRDTLPDLPELSDRARLVDPPQFVGHNDITPQNVVIRDGEPVGLVDFDLAGPTSPAREIANAALHWAPLCDPTDRTPALTDVDPMRRTRLIADGYGLRSRDRTVLAEVLIRQTQGSWHRMHYLAVEYGGGWARMWDEGVGDSIRRREQWLLRHGASLTRTLLVPPSVSDTHSAWSG